MDKSDLIDEKYKISVIVPCYNTEKYVEKCIESILGQTYKNLEVILVDDGSTDSTGDICDRYALLDRRVIVIHKKNGGASAARNAGIKAASGAFIVFADSDDWLIKHAYKYLMYLILKYNADCAIGRTVRAIEKNGRVLYDKVVKLPDKVTDSDDVVKSLFKYGCGAVNKLIKKEYFDGIEFEEGIINEDELIMLKLYLKMKVFAVAGRRTYFYLARENSVTRSSFSLRNLDFYNNTLKNIDLINKTRPELLEDAKARHYKAAIYCAAKLHFHLYNQAGCIYRRKIKNELRNHRKDIIINRFISLQYKVIGIVCSLL